MTEKLFSESKHSSVYSKFRPSPPESLIEYLVARVQGSPSWSGKKGSVAADIGCGTGQCTQPLSPYFEFVYGMDVSEAQVNEAVRMNQWSNVQYQVSPAETTALSNNSINLITAAQAFHWFKHDLFYQEVKRILKPNGILGLICYEVPNVLLEKDTDGTTTLDGLKFLVKNFRDDFARSEKTKKYWRHEANSIENQYSSYELPLVDIEKKQFIKLVPLVAADVVGYIESWSCVQQIKGQEPQVYEEIMAKLKEDLIQYSNSGHCDLNSIKLNLEYNFLLISGVNK